MINGLASKDIGPLIALVPSDVTPDELTPGESGLSLIPKFLALVFCWIALTSETTTHIVNSLKFLGITSTHLVKS